MRRIFNTQSIDHLYIENKIGQAINELRDMRDENNKFIHKYHNLTKVVSHLDKVHNVKINNSSIATLSLEQSKQAKASYRTFKWLYTNKANKYKKASGNNYTFEPVETGPRLLLRAVEDLFRIK